jgi:hypothetical protein
MTVFGKLLAFLNLVVGLGLAMWSVNLYTNRPSWYDAPSDVVDKGNSPITFKQMTDEIASLGKTAASVSGKWGAELAVVEQREALRKDRQGKHAARLVLARTSNNANKQYAFTELVVDPVTGLTDLSQFGAPIVGPPAPGEATGQPLRGSDTLLARMVTDNAAIIQVAEQSQKLRKQERALAEEIKVVDTKYLKQTDIREHLTNEYLFLAAFEVNVYEDRETVFKRKAQLQRRLSIFGPSGGGN